MSKYLFYSFGVDGRRNGKQAVFMKAAVGNQDMQVGVKPQWKIPECLYGGHRTGHSLLIPHAGCVKGFQRLPATPAQFGKQAAVVKEIPPKDFGDAQHRVPVRNRLYHFPTKPFAEFHHAFLVARGAEMPPLA